MLRPLSVRFGSRALPDRGRLCARRVRLCGGLSMALAAAAASLASSASAGNYDGLNEAAGVNQTLDEGFGARQSGMAVTFASFQRGADAVVNSPAGMNDVDDFTFATSHAEKFGEAQFDDIAFLLPFEANSTLGIGLARYGVSGIELRPEGSDPLESQPAGLFSVADYMLAASFARRWGAFDAGFALNLLYRHLDQDGMGMRGDAMVQYSFDKDIRVSALMKGLIPSTTTWQSGYTEYETPDLQLGAAARIPAPYFYGTLEVAWQSEGLVQERAKSAQYLTASRLIDNPGAILATSNLGLEFMFDFGMAVRVGASEFNSSLASAATFGIGYDWRHILAFDYSFTPHPDLLSTHRISLQFTPAFPKFNGRDYRHGGSRPARPASDASAPPAAPAPAAAPVSPAPAASPASAPALAAPTQAAPDKAAPATPQAKPAPAPASKDKPAPGQEKEILDNED